MCKCKTKKYFTFMGCLTWILSIVLMVGIIITIIDMFGAGLGAWPIVEQFLLLLAVCTIGPAIGMFFFSYSSGLEHEKDCKCNK